MNTSKLVETYRELHKLDHDTDYSDLDTIYITSIGHIHTKRELLEWALPIFNKRSKTGVISKGAVYPPDDLWERIVSILNLELVDSEEDETVQMVRIRSI